MYNKEHKSKRRFFLSSRSVKKAEHTKALLTKYKMMFVNDPDDAEMVLLPRDLAGLTQQQKKDMQRAIRLGIRYMEFPESVIYDMELQDPLKLEEYGFTGLLVHEMTHEAQQPVLPDTFEDDDTLELVL